MPKITKRLLDHLPPCKAGERQFLRDTEVKGFGVRVTQSVKTFFVEHRVRGNSRMIRISIGGYPSWQVKDARQHAMSLIVKMDKGIDPRH